jgi:hypothetical protein
LLAVEHGAGKSFRLIQANQTVPDCQQPVLQKDSAIPSRLRRWVGMGRQEHAAKIRLEKVSAEEYLGQRINVLAAKCQLTPDRYPVSQSHHG